MSTCSKMPPVGDRGQRYEIHYIHIDSGEDKIFGWSNEPVKLAAAARLMPSAKAAYSLDRKTNHRWEARLRIPVYCRVCGIVMRSDQSNKPCKGPTRLRKKGIE